MPLDLTSGLGFATEVGRLPQQTECLHTLEVPVRMKGQSSNWSGKTIWKKKKEEEEDEEDPTVTFCMTSQFWLSGDQAGTFVVRVCTCGGGHSWCVRRGGVSPVLKSFTQFAEASVTVTS